ncbi:MAG: B12-binding domain-containing radical SAM protein [Anaerolineales bacterium]|nr:B12-binding domain-containing radical SAM protein [Anaerolineales bacterium]
MNILLLYPRFPDTFWSFRHALKFIRKKASSPPLGLLTVAAMLPAEWQLRLVDLNVSQLNPRDLEWADYAFISAMTVQRASAQKAIEACQQAGVKIVAGGPLFTSEHETFPAVDHFVLNEAEITLPQFLADLQAGQAQRVYATDDYPDLQQTPIPRWELVNFKHYATMDVQYSRGCPYDCDFCNITALFGRRPRLKSGAQIIAELDRLYQLGWRGGIFFVDDNFIGNKKLLKQDLLPALIRWRQGKTGLLFSTEVSINLVDDPELTMMMVAAGFTTVFIGIETPSEASLAECNKFQNKNRDLVESVKILQRAGLQVQGGFIVGFDSDSPGIFQQQLDFIQQSGIVSAMVGLLQAPLGTRLYARMQAERRLLPEISGNNVDGSTNIVPKMGFETLLTGYRQLLSQIYSPRLYYERMITFLKEYQPPRLRVAVSGEHLLALWLSIYHLGIRGVERAYYWKLWLWVLSHRPRLFPNAITLAIYGYHFRRICELNG